MPRQPRSREELYRAIRQGADAGMSIRELAARYSAHRRTVRKAINGDGTPGLVERRRSAPRLGPVKARIDLMLQYERDHGCTYSIRQIRDRLLRQVGAEYEISYSSVRDYVRRQRSALVDGSGTPASSR